jgi:hypothetical protein
MFARNQIFEVQNNGKAFDFSDWCSKADGLFQRRSEFKEPE